MATAPTVDSVNEWTCPVCDRMDKVINFISEEPFINCCGLKFHILDKNSWIFIKSMKGLCQINTKIAVVTVVCIVDEFLLSSC